MRTVRAVPRRDRATGGGVAAARARAGARIGRARARSPGRRRAGDAGRVDLRARTDGGERRRIRDRAVGPLRPRWHDAWAGGRHPHADGGTGVAGMSTVMLAPPRRLVDLE